MTVAANIVEITPAALEKTARSYRYDANTFRGLERHVWKAVQTYAGAYGQGVIEHLSRVSATLYEFLVFSGFDNDIARNVAHAFRLHDAGKTLQPPSLWNLPAKPDAEIKRQRSSHVFLGKTVLEQALPSFPQLAGHPHLSVVECLMRHHHERIDGRGPVGLTDDHLGLILEYTGIVDGLDGKMIPRANGEARSVADVLREMSGLPQYTSETKHDGEFKFERLRDVAAYYERRTGQAVFTRP